MSAKEIFDQVAQDVMDAIGEYGVFTPASGDPVSCMVDISQESAQEPGQYDTQVFVSVTTIEYLKSVIGRDPVKGETFIVDGETWTVVAPFEDSNSNDSRFGKVVVRK